MQWLILGSIAVTAVFAGSAVAADIPVKARPAAPPAVTTSWSGVYIGIGLGARRMESDWATTATFDPAGGPLPFFLGTDPNASFSNTAFRVSGYAGVNWQVAPAWIIGLETDFGWANNRDILTSRIPGLGVLNAGSFTEVKGKWDASTRARAGVLVTPAVLAYATGGVAFQQIKAIATCPADTFVCNPAVGTQSFSNSRTRAGWTVGGGIETMFAHNWLARVEYRYSDFRTFSFTAIPFSVSTFGANADLSTTTHVVYGGLAYKFGGGPVTARY